MSRKHPGSRHHKALNQRLWAQAERACRDRDGWRCTRCGVAGRLECHHVVPLDVDPEQDPYAVQGLVTLCRTCHIAEHRREPTREEAAWRVLITDLTNDH